MNVITARSFVAAAILGFASFASLAQSVAASPCEHASALTALQKQIIAKADQSVGALRDYLFLTRGIYNLSMDEAVTMLDRQRDAQRSCRAAGALATSR